MEAGIIPSFDFPGEITPGQFGPTSLVPGKLFKIFVTSIMSKTGTPSVIQIIKFIPFSAASSIADFVNFAGTKITEVSISSKAHASFTESKTGLFRCS